MRIGFQQWCRQGSSLGVEAEACADGVADHGEWHPGSDEKAVSAHESAAVVDGEEGALELLQCAAGLAEAVAGGQVQNPDAGDGEEDDAGDPDIACSVVLLDAADDEAAEHWDQEREEGAEQLGRG